MSQLNVDTIGSQTGTSIAVASGHTLSNPAIGFEHIDTTTFTSAASWSKSSVFSATYDDVSGFSVTMTPKSTTNKFVVLGDIHIWHTDTYGGVKLVQNASGSFADLVEKKYLGRQFGLM